MAAKHSHSVDFDPDSESVLEVVVRSVAAVQNTEPATLEPLENSVDTELLQTAVDAKANGSIDRAVITFQWEDTTVTLNTDGEVTIEWE